MLRPHHDKLRAQLPNWLTISRVAVIVPIALLLTYWTTPLGYALACLLSAYAMITDYWDGYLSRKWNVVSDFGRLLDPVADKLLVASLLILLSIQGYGHPLAVTLIMLREITVSALREFAQEHGIILHVTKMAKYKTTLQMIAAFLLLLAGTMPDMLSLHYTGDGVLWAACWLTCYTGYDYAKALMQKLSTTSATEDNGNSI